MSDTGHLAQARPVVVTLPAEIDITNAHAIGEALSSVIAGGAGIVIADMTSTRFCNSSGISMLVQAHRQAAANNAELRLVVRCPHVLRVMGNLGVDVVLAIYQRREEAHELVEVSG